MAAMQSGKCLMWAQAPSTSRGDSMITISDWQSHHAFQTPSAPGVLGVTRTHEVNALLFDSLLAGMASQTPKYRHFGLVQSW